MRKVLVTILVIIMICTGVYITSSADSEYIFDYKGVFSSEELASLEAVANKVYENTSTKVFFIMEDVLEEGVLISDFTEKFFEEHGKDSSCVILTLTDDSYFFLPLGKAADIVDIVKQDTLWNAFNDAENDYQGVIAYYTEVERMINSYNSKSEINYSDNLQGKRMIDNAEVLDPIAKSTISDFLDEISTIHKCDVIVLTVPSMYGKTPSSYGQEYYSYNDFGFNDTDDGVMLTYSVDNKQWSVDVFGNKNEAFNADVIEYLEKQIKSSLRRRKYDAAFTIFADNCYMILSDEAEGQIHNTETLPSQKLSIGVIPLSIIVAVIVVVIVSFVIKTKKKGARP